MVCARVLVSLALLFSSGAALGSAPEPWPALHGGAFDGPAAPSSPDPLVRYRWGPSVNASVLQIIELSAVAIGPSVGTPPGSFQGVESAVGSTSTNISVGGPGTLIIDWGVEAAAWFEFDSPDLSASDAKALVMGTGEYNEVDFMGSFKSGPPSVYGHTFRLETNAALYEGVRYSFLTLPSAPGAPFTISGLRAVAQAKPANYSGSFSSPGDPLLARVWYSAVYTVRAALQSDYFGSILEDRGDRMSWTGDAHPAQATALAAFENYHPFVLSNLNRTSTDCQGIATYCLYFVLSLLDYYRASGDAGAIAAFSANVAAKLEVAKGMYDDPQGLRFAGWDDRLGSGFANNTTPETQALYRMLAIRCWRGFGDALNATGAGALGAHFAGYADAAMAALRAASPTWWAGFGLHAGADAINTGLLTPPEASAIAAAVLSDLVVLPSQSNFVSKKGVLFGRGCLCVGERVAPALFLLDVAG